MAIGRGETVLTLPTGSAGTGSTSTRARASVRAGALPTMQLLRVNCLMKRSISSLRAFNKPCREPLDIDRGTGHLLRFLLESNGFRMKERWHSI
jgi:hypothetical protein